MYNNILMKNLEFALKHVLIYPAFGLISPYKPIFLTVHTLLLPLHVAIPTIR